MIKPIALLAAACLFCACQHHESHEGHDHHNHEAQDHSHHHDHNHEPGHEHGDVSAEEAHSATDVIELEPDVAARFGVKTQKAEIGPVGGALKVSGTLQASAENVATATATSSGIVMYQNGVTQGRQVGRGSVLATIKADGLSGGDANIIAKEELKAAQTEYERLQALYADRLVRLSELNAAKAAYERALAAYSPSGAKGSVTAPIAGVITQILVPSGAYVQTGDAVATIADDARLSLMLQVPAKDFATVAAARDARIVTNAGATTTLVSALGGRRESTTAAAAAGGYVPVVFSVPNDGSLIPGTSVEAFILTDADRQAIKVPLSAIWEQEGEKFVFCRLDEDCYRKLPVKTGISDGNEIEIISGITPGEDIVVEGVTAVRLAAASGAVPEGHSHSH